MTVGLWPNRPWSLHILFLIDLKEKSILKLICSLHFSLSPTFSPSYKFFSSSCVSESYFPLCVSLCSCLSSFPSFPYSIQKCPFFSYYVSLQFPYCYSIGLLFPPIAFIVTHGPVALASGGRYVIYRPTPYMASSTFPLLIWPARSTLDDALVSVWFTPSAPLKFAQSHELWRTSILIIIPQHLSLTI